MKPPEVAFYSNWKRVSETCNQVSCRQVILQIGGLNWEDQFIDCSLYEKFIILDDKALGTPEALKIRGKAYALPIQTSSVDLVIIPHLLEFDAQRFQTMREVERILKPEGELIIRNFNPWNLWVRYQFIWDKKWSNPCERISSVVLRVLDWLKLLNFQVKMSAEFNVDQIDSEHKKFALSVNPLLAMAYAVKAVKRRYTLIPLTPVKLVQPRLAIAENMETSPQNRRTCLILSLFIPMAPAEAIQGRVAGECFCNMERCKKNCMEGRPRRPTIEWNLWLRFKRYKL